MFLFISIISCKTNSDNFEKFEISSTDGWIENYSFILYKDSSFILKKSPKNEWGKLNESEFQSLLSQIQEVKNKKLNSKTETCYDCSKVSIKITSKNDTLKIIQKGDISKEIDDLKILIKKITFNKKNFILKTYETFETQKDLEPPFPPKILNYK